MIRSLKYKFVLLSMLSLCLLLCLIVTGMNVMNYNAVVAEADEMLSLLSENRGMFPMPRMKIPRGMSPEAPYESRFFTVLLDKSGTPLEVITERIALVDREKALDYASQVIAEGRAQGFMDEFRYSVKSENEHVHITFLDCGRRLDAFEAFLRSSIVMSICGLAAVFLVIMFSAERIIRPVSEAYEKQKRFISDAGHEIKTPLTIISANADLLELDMGENECLTDIRQQTKRLSALTNDLVYLARMEEADIRPHMVELPLSDIVAETVASFKAPAQAQGKELVCDIEPLLSMKGDHKALEQLISILMDNALKYSPAGESIFIRLKKSGRQLQLAIRNKTLAPMDGESLKHLFERFYRADASRNSSTGGYGIGLSIASTISSAHSGRIQAKSEDGSELEITVMFPI